MGLLVVPCDGSCSPRSRLRQHRLSGRLALASATVLLTACTGSDPTRLHAPGIAYLEIEGPSSLIVHERALFDVRARGFDGEELPLPQGLVWESSYRTVATVSQEGVVTAHERGEVVIGVRWGEVRGQLAIGVRYRVRLAPAHRSRPCRSCDSPRQAFFGAPGSPDGSWQIAIGDTLRFVATHVNIDGIVLEEDVPATWTSTDPAVRVLAPGIVVGLSSEGLGADLVATTSDGAGTTHVSVADVTAGLPAMLRVAHAAVAAGPVTFVFNKLAPVTLSFGEFLDIPLSSGLFYVDIQGSPPPDFPLADFRSFGAMVHEGDRLAVYAVGSNEPFLSGVWDRPTEVSDGSVRVRLIQGYTSAQAVYVLPADAAPEGSPPLCYFDPLDYWGYVELPAGGVDFVMQPKYGDPYEARFRESPTPGSSVTYVLTESAGDPLDILAFVEK